MSSLIGEGRKEGHDVACETLWFFRGSEVSTALHGGPLTNVVKAFCPLARRSAIVDELVGEYRNRRRHADEILQAQGDSEPAVIEVIAHGRRDRLGRPVDRDGRQELILTEAPLHFAAAVTPGTV